MWSLFPPKPAWQARVWLQGGLVPAANGGLLIRHVEVQVAACRDRVHQGLQLRRRGRLATMPATSAAARSRGEPGADRAQRPQPGRRR
jgi:hypothetical protein